MARVDAKVAHILDRRRDIDDVDDEDEDALIAELEDDDDIAVSAIREQRLEQLHAELSRAKVMKEASFGTYSEIKDEKEILSITTSNKLCIVHFMKTDFNRCRIMDEKLAILAPKHFDTRFVSINVDNAPWLVVKLGIQVLPCVIAFIDGVSQDRIVGFEGIGRGNDRFSVEELEQRLLQSGVLVRAKMLAEDNAPRSKKIRSRAEDNDDDEWD